MASRYFHFFIFFIFSAKISAKEFDLKCSVDFCDDYVQRFPCPPLHPDCSNSTKSLVIPSPTVCNCCEHCFLFQDIEDNCIVGTPGQSLPNVMCKPGAECVEGFCKKKNTPDPDFHPGYECQNGICYCTVVVNTSTEKIFGSFEETENIKKEKQCECSISAHRARQTMNRLLPLPDLYLPVARCLPNGQFDPLQCVGEMCGCVNRTTGTWNTSIRKVHIAALGPGNPECFDEERHTPGEYYTICEKERNDLMVGKFWADIDGEEIVFSHKVLCTPDGRYDN